MSGDIGQIQVGRPPASVRSVAPVSPVGGPATPPAPSSVGPTITAPPIIVAPPVSGGKGRTLLLLGIGVLVLIIVVAIVAAMMSGNGGQVATPTPTPTPSPSATLSTQTKTLTSYFGNPKTTVELSYDTPSKDLLRNALLIAEPAGRLATVWEVRRGGSRLAAESFLAASLGSVSADLTAALGSDLVVMAYGQTETYDANGVKTDATTVQPRLAVVVEVADASKANQVMTAWETTGLASAGEKVFGYLVSRKVVEGFSSGTYRQVPIRYWNFPYADISLDWAIALASNGKNYLLLTGSREAAFFVIDQLMQ